MSFFLGATNINYIGVVRVMYTLIENFSYIIKDNIVATAMPWKIWLGGDIN